MEIKVFKPGESDKSLSENDLEMDKRAVAAVRAALSKAEICNEPIARYDSINKKAYIEYPDGERKYVG